MTVLITVESLIAGFMIAYGALNMQMLTYWAEPAHGGGTNLNLLVGTFMAGLVIYAIVLTCFASISFLYWSLKAANYDARYNWGLALFGWAIFLSAIYVIRTVKSTYTFTVTTDPSGLHVPLVIPVMEATRWYHEFWVYVIVLVSLCAFVAIAHGFGWFKKISQFLKA